MDCCLLVKVCKDEEDEDGQEGERDTGRAAGKESEEGGMDGMG